jgi:hypothetical protein
MFEKYTGVVYNDELQKYTESNVLVRDGNLEILTERTADGQYVSVKVVSKKTASAMVPLKLELNCPRVVVRG